MDKKLLKISSLTTALNFIVTFWGIENCSAQTISGACSGSQSGGCFNAFTNQALPYITNSFEPASCGVNSTTAVIDNTVDVQFSFTNSNPHFPVYFYLNNGSDAEPATFTIPAGTNNTLRWGTQWCNTLTFTFKAINPADPEKKQRSLHKTM